MKKTEQLFESLMFQSRWLLAPFFFGLIIAIMAMLVKFGKQLFTLVLALFGAAEHDVIISILTLIDTALVASLLLIIAFSGYENFVSKIGTGEHEDRPAWMGKVGFSDLKIKLMGAIVAISAVELLKAFINADNLTNTQLGWRAGIHLVFVVSGVLFAITDKITEGKDGGH
ncbi:MAG: TIGR00645 family protein [Nitrospirota bacterium]|nr:TIGR00645 family protein [Nitrospirota bacterium]